MLISVYFVFKYDDVCGSECLTFNQQTKDPREREKDPENGNKRRIQSCPKKEKGRETHSYSLEYIYITSSPSLLGI